METNRGSESRQRALAPYLSKLSGLASHAGESGRQSVLRIGGEILRIDAWERTLVLEALDRSGQRSLEDWPGFLADGVALQTKSLLDLEKWKGVENSSDEALRSLVEELRLDTALAMALMTETQQAVNHLVQSASMEDAKNLTRYRNKLGKTLSALKESLGGSDLSLAESMAVELSVVDPSPEAGERTGKHTPRDATAILRESEQLDELVDAAEKGELPDVPAGIPGALTEAGRRRSSVPYLMAVLVLCAVAWGVVHFVYLPSGPEFPVLTRADFDHLGALNQVVARPPSLYVTVDREVWTQLADQERLELMEGIAGVTEQAGYHGVLLRSDGGKALGQWLKNGGVKLHKLPDPSLAAENRPGK